MPLLAPSPIGAEQFRRLHPRAIEGADVIRSILELVRDEGITLSRGTNRSADRELAKIVKVGDRDLVIRTENFERLGTHVFLSFELSGRPYFFTSTVVQLLGEELASLGHPAVVYEAERRDRARRFRTGNWRDVKLRASGVNATPVEVCDESSGGLAVLAPANSGFTPGDSVTLRAAGRSVEHAEVRNVSNVNPAGVRLGLALHPSARKPLAPVERRNEPEPSRLSIIAREGLASAAITARIAARRFISRALQRDRRSTQPNIVDYKNTSGERIRAIVDSTGETHGAPVVVIPPAWGRTKETLLPLSLTIVETFKAAKLPVSVLRFDGVRKRGESHNDPACASPGQENLHYTFSQGARDILATLDFLETSPQYNPSTVILVTFSVTSIEGRHAIALEERNRIGGWISVMGALDPQSLIRVISGGVDYVGGVERGVRFGLQDVQGMLLDIDRAGRDALECGIGFLEDARREMARIAVPVTWIHGRHDAWMSIERVRDALSFGETANRRIVEVPTGHQLKSSRQALGVFQLIAHEVGRMAVGAQLEPRLPDLAVLDARREVERNRLRRAQLDLKSFWRDYLIGRDGKLGMELVTHTSQYEIFMDEQVRALDLQEGETVVDLGSGIGTFPMRLAEMSQLPRDLCVLEVDYVAEALTRARNQVRNLVGAVRFDTRFIAAEVGKAQVGLPFSADRADAVLASLLINYVDDPRALLSQIRRILRPYGRLILSGLKRDADVSGICVGGVRELRTGRGREAFGRAEVQIGRSLQSFISDAARLLDFEERGIFRFWDADELSQLVAAAGFVEVEVAGTFGDPPQATLLSARKPA